MRPHTWTKEGPPQAVRVGPSPAVRISPSRLVPLASLADEKAGITVTALRAAAERGRLRAQKSDSGIWLSSRKWLADYVKNKHKRSDKLMSHGT
jgi:hypothetical protein